MSVSSSSLFAFLFSRCLVSLSLFTSRSPRRRRYSLNSFSRSAVESFFVDRRMADLFAYCTEHCIYDTSRPDVKFATPAQPMARSMDRRCDSSTSWDSFLPYHELPPATEWVRGLFPIIRRISIASTSVFQPCFCTCSCPHLSPGGEYVSLGLRDLQYLLEI